MDWDKADEIIRLLDSIDTTLREMRDCVCVGSSHMKAVQLKEIQIAGLERCFDAAIQQQRETEDCCGHKGETK